MGGVPRRRPEDPVAPAAQAAPRSTGGTVPAEGAPHRAAPGAPPATAVQRAGAHPQAATAAHKAHKGKVIRPRQRLGKYRVVRRLAMGGFATVYEAIDTLEGIKVALKIPHAGSVSPALLEDLRREVRLLARLDHPNVLPLKTADMIDGHFVLVHPVAEGTLADRMQRRLSTAKALSFGEQLLAALAHAHGHRIVHCDVKPENLLLFPGGRLRLTDFGIAKIALRTRTGSGSGTVGYLSPEQAMGRPSFRSDVFSAGLILYRMLTGVLPRWPFAWPGEGYERLRRRVPEALVEVLRRALEVDEHKRFRDAQPMLEAFRRGQRGSRPASRRKAAKPVIDWRRVRIRQFVASHGKALQLRLACRKCGGMISYAMRHCPWCAASHGKVDPDPSFPAHCPRCRRGVKLDWTFCAHCYGAAIGPLSTRSFGDRRYVARCAARTCSRRDLMPFMRYCPWCRAKVRRAWAVPGTRERCGHCGWGVTPDYWRCCPWCGKSIARRPPRAR